MELAFGWNALSCLPADGLHPQAGQTSARPLAPRQLPASRSLCHGFQLEGLTDPCSASAHQLGVTLSPQPLGRGEEPRYFQGWGWGLSVPLTRGWLRGALSVVPVAGWGAASQPWRALAQTQLRLSPSTPDCPQVKSVNLSEGELLSIRGVDGPTLTILANQTLLVEGQVIRSPTNTISVYFRTFQDDGLGTFQLHYQGRSRPRLLQCSSLPHFLSGAKSSQTFCPRGPSGSLRWAPSQTNAFQSRKY